MKKNIIKKRLFIGVFFLFFICKKQVYAFDVDDGTSGIFQVVSTYSVENEDSAQEGNVEVTYVEENETGFLIGTNNNVQYIVTSNRIIEGVEGAKEVTTEIIISADVKIRMSLIANSDELGICIWETEKEIYGKNAIIINDNADNCEYSEPMY